MADEVPETLDEAIPLEPAPPKSRTRTIVGWAIKLGLLAAIFTYLVKTDRLKASDLKALAQRWDLTLLALSLFIPAMLVCALRYQLLLRALNINAHYGDIAAFSMIGMLFDLISPVSNGGDIVKALYLSRTTSVKSSRRGFGVILFSVLLDRIVGFFALFTFALIVCLSAWPRISSYPELRQTTFVVMVVCLGGLLGFFVFASEKLEKSPLRKRILHILPFHEKFEKVYAGFAGLRHHKRILATMIGLSIVNHMLCCSSILILAQGMDFTSALTGLPAHLELVPCLTILPLGLFVNTFGPAGGLGAGNLGFDFLFRNVLHLSGGAVLVLRYQICGILFRLIGVPFLIFYKHKGVNLDPNQSVLKSEAEA